MRISHELLKLPFEIAGLVGMILWVTIGRGWGKVEVDFELPLGSGN